MGIFIVFVKAQSENNKQRNTLGGSKSRLEDSQKFLSQQGCEEK